MLKGGRSDDRGMSIRLIEKLGIPPRDWEGDRPYNQSTNNSSPPGSGGRTDCSIRKTIHKIGNAQKHSAYPYRADKVMFVIITDGEENASREYSLP